MVSFIAIQFERPKYVLQTAQSTHYIKEHLSFGVAYPSGHMHRLCTEGSELRGALHLYLRFMLGELV